MNANSRRRNSKKGKSARQAVPNDLLMLASVRPVGAADVSFVKEDLYRRQGSWALTQTPPRSVSNQIYWVKANSETTSTVSTSVPMEVNFSFTLQQFPNLVSLSSYFDQYCIYSAIVNITFQLTGSSGSVSGLGTMLTAIDYDNITNLGSFSSLEAYESCLATKVTATQCVQRLIKPAVAPALWGGSSFNAYGISRMWCDSATTTTPHYGFRSFLIGNTAAVLTVNYDIVGILGFRNNF
jgi:hypothetical protein